MTHRADSDRAVPLAKIVLAIAFVAAIAAFFVFGGPRYLSLESVKEHRDALRAFADEHLVSALLVAFAIYAGVVALSLPGALLLSLTAGFVFGRWIGTALAIAAATTGATLVFLAARYLFADAARQRLGATGARINAGFTANAFSYLLFLRLVPLFPFFVVNLAPAFTSIPLRTYVAATALGIVPGTFVYVNLGQALGRLDSVRGLVSGETLLAFVLLGALALVPAIVHRWRSRAPAGRR